MLLRPSPPPLRNSRIPILPPPKTLLLRIRNPKITSSSSSPSPLLQIKPFLQAQWRPILKGWFFSSLSVCCLSLSVPRVARIPSLLSSPPGPDALAREGTALALLALARAAAAYLQQAFLWEAALRSAYSIRLHVFGRVLERDLGFFEGGEGIPAGDVAHRLTAEASDVADTVYALFNVMTADQEVVSNKST